jgi:tetratricopeptide (TPR) repeat protein
MPEPAQPLNRPGWQLPLAVAALIALVFVPIAMYGCEGELDRWRAAVLMERYLDGEQERAINGLAEIVERQPADQQLRVTLAQWLLDDRQAARALALIGEVPEQMRSRSLLKVLQDCLVAVGKTEEALRVFRQRYPANELPNPDERNVYLNELAYLRALDGSGLKHAEKNSTQVVANIAHNWNVAFGIDLSAHQQVALAAVLIYRGSAGVPAPGQKIRTREFRDVMLEILDREIFRLENEPRAAPETGLPPEMPGRGDSPEPTDEELPQADPPPVDALATMLTARALVWQDLGKPEKSFADRQRVLELGYDPAAIAGKWPGLPAWFQQLMWLATVLDTRGCVIYQRGDPERALQDLDAAVMGQLALVEGDASRLPGIVIETTDLRERRAQFEEQPRKTLAVLLYHRSWALWSLGHYREAQADVRQIRELGYQPGAHLF